MNHLIVGLGNIGHEYDGTRHNIGFSVVDYLAEEAGATWEDKRYGFVTTIRVKNQTLILLKPSTYMNLSGNAVRYWMNEKKIPIEQTLIVVDDLALPFGHLRLKASGSEAGHNGLKHITQTLGTQQYARLRFGIGNDFPKGGLVDFVLGQFGPEDRQQMPEALKRAAEAVKSYVENVLPQYKLDQKDLDVLNAEADSGVIDDEYTYNDPDDDGYNPDDDPDAAVWSH